MDPPPPPYPEVSASLALSYEALTKRSYEVLAQAKEQLTLAIYPQMAALGYAPGTYTIDIDAEDDVAGQSCKLRAKVGPALLPGSAFVIGSPEYIGPIPTRQATKVFEPVAQSQPRTPAPRTSTSGPAWQEGTLTVPRPRPPKDDQKVSVD